MALLLTPFYRQMLRKYHITFGQCFSNLTMLRDINDTEVQRIVVPIEYVPRESWLTRLRSDAKIESKVSNVWPKLAFEMTGMRYDPTRRLNGMNHQLVGTPYILSFSLYGIMRSVEDLNQILEQILPYFTPDYTLVVNSLPSLGIQDQMRILFDGQPTWTDSFEADNFTRTCEIVVTFNFSAGVMLYGPTPTTDPAIVRKVIVDLYDASLDASLAGPSYVLNDTYGRMMTETDGGMLDESTATTFQDLTQAVEIVVVPKPLDAQPPPPVDTTTTITDYMG